MSLLIRSIFLLLTFHTLAIPLLAQDKASLNQELGTYLEHFVNKEYGAMLEYMHPAVFELASKDTLLAEMESLDDDEDFIIAYERPSFDPEYEILSDGADRYTKVNTNFFMSLQLRTDSTEDIESTENFLLSLYHLQFGEENVELDKEAHTFYVHINGAMYAIWKEEFGSWKIINEDQSASQLLKKIIPEPIKKELDE